ncbi:protein transport protein SFT2 [Leptopilina heterotoma]|uniref:protein transport protein SFT2 n=1 Tax=Leptopilina heterotoma TaxID=63436 RepID=UPI001CA8B243|nr:protein transport protein SFT2 [Leptopilina heterotoma]
MSNLNQELNEYLLNNKNEKQFKISIPSVKIPKPQLGKWFRKEVEEESVKTACCPTLTRFQRLTAFAFCFFTGIICFILSAIYIPVLLLKARKFALCYSLGSFFFILSFCFLWGPMNYMKSLSTPERRCFSISYFASLFGTLYFSLHLQSTPLTVLCAIFQLIAMVSFAFSHIPGGVTGLMFFTKMFKSSVNSSLLV